MAGLYGALLSGSSLALPPLKPETPDAGLPAPADEGARALAAAEQRLQMQLQRLHNPPMKVYIGLQNTARMEEHAHEDEGECGRRGGPGDCALTKAHPPAAPRIAALEQEDSEGTELEA